MSHFPVPFGGPKGNCDRLTGARSLQRRGRRDSEGEPPASAGSPVPRGGLERKRKVAQILLPRGFRSVVSWGNGRSRHRPHSRYRPMIARSSPTWAIVADVVRVVVGRVRQGRNDVGEAHGRGHGHRRVGIRRRRRPRPPRPRQGRTPRATPGSRRIPSGRRPEHQLSTFAIDVDTASYAERPPVPDAGDAPAAQGRGPGRGADQLLPLCLSAADGRRRRSRCDVEVADCPWDEGHRLARIGLKGREVAPTGGRRATSSS